MRVGTCLAGLLALTLAVGCGGYSPDTGVIVTGKLVQDGSPINNPRNAVGYGGVEVILVGTSAGLPRASTFCEDSGVFEILDAGKGVPPGKYKLAVIVHDSSPPAGGAGGPPGGPPGGPGGSGGDKLGGKLSEQSTPIEIDVPEDKMGGKFDAGTIEIAPHLK